MTNPIIHTKSCEQRLLGIVAEHYPHGTFTLQNLRDGAAAIRRSRFEPKCECSRIQLATLNKEIQQLRRAGRVAGLEELTAARAALRQARLNENARWNEPLDTADVTV